MDVIDVGGKDLLLLLLNGTKVAAFDICLDHGRHATNDHVLTQISSKPGTQDLGYNLAPFETLSKRRDRLWKNSLRPQELLEIKRMHRHLSLVTNGNGSRL